MNFLSFYIDVFSLFPIEVMVYAANLSVDESQRIYYLLQLNRILRIWRLHKIFQDFEKDLSKNILVDSITINFNIFNTHLTLGYQNYEIYNLFSSICILGWSSFIPRGLYVPSLYRR